MYTQEKKEQAEDFKEHATTLGRFVLDKAANLKVNFSDNKTKRFWGKVLRKGIANWAVSWLTPKEQEIYTKIYGEKPWIPALQGSVYNLAATGYPIFKGMEAFSDITLNAILGGVYGIHVLQNSSRLAATFIDGKRSYPPPALITLGVNSPTFAREIKSSYHSLIKKIYSPGFVKKFRDDYNETIRGLSSTAQAQGVIDPMASSVDRKNGKEPSENERKKEHHSLEDKLKTQ